MNKKIFFGIFIFTGLIFFFIGITIWKSDKNFEKISDIVIGEISDIELYYSGDSKLYNVFVDYEYKDIVYNNILINTYDISMYTGKQLKLYVNQKNPYEVRYTNSFIPLIFCFVGSIFATIGITMSIIDAQKTKSKTNKKQEKIITCYIENIEDDYSLTVNECPSRVAICVHENIQTGERKIFKSSKSFKIEYDDINKIVDVYINELTGEYFVDLQTIQRNNF